MAAALLATSDAGRAAARPRRRHRQPARDRGLADPRAVRPRRGGARLAPLGGAPSDARGADRRAARALAARPRAGRRRRDHRLLRHLPRLPQPQERRAAAAARRLFDRQLADLDRGLFGGHDPAALLHDAVGTGLADARLLGRLHAVLPLHPGHARPRAGVLARTSAAGSSTPPRCRSTGCWARRATSCCPRSGRSTPSPAPSRRWRAPTPRSCRPSCSTSAPSSCATRRSGRRRASAPSRRCTSRSSSRPRSPRTCSGSAAR